jgi:hypothetical protein
MRIRPTLVVATLALALIGLPAAGWAQKVDVHAGADKGVDFKGLKTYKWLPPPTLPRTVAPGVPTGRRTIEQIDPVIHEAVDRELSAKGYQRLDSGDADLLVGYLINLGTDANEFTMADEYASVTGTTIYFGFGSMSRTTSLTYADIGTLAVGVVEGKTKRVMWRGIAKTKITFDTPHARVDGAIHDGVGKMFGKFPKQSDK